MTELHEQSKPKPEPFGYFKVTHAGIIDCNKTDKGSFPLYKELPTREPLSEELLMALAEECTTQFFNGVHQNATIHFARAVEKAHGIGVMK